MVVSVLDKSINYQEYKKINEEDRDKDVLVYVGNYKNVDIAFALGNEQYTYIEKSIIYFPMYLMFQDEPVEKIGIFEIMSGELQSVIDDEGFIDVDKLNEPLLFSYITTEYLQQYEYVDSEEEEEEYDDFKAKSITPTDIFDRQEESDSDSEDESIYITDIDESEEEDNVEEDEKDKEDYTQQPDLELERKTIIPSILYRLYEEDVSTETLAEETKETQQEIERNFKLSQAKNWIQKAYRNPYFKIIENEGGGDCFFASIRNAYQSIGKEVTVKDLRKLVADEADENLYETFKLLYDSIKNEEKELLLQINAIKKKHKELKLVSKKSTTKENSKMLIEQGNKLLDIFHEKNNQLALQRQLLEEYEFMEDVDSLDELKDVIQTSKFWAETWTISTLERVLNMKVIILSKEAYEEGDTNIIQCGQLNDTILSEKGEFKPKYYIPLEWIGNHYRNIEYRGKEILLFEEVPYSIRKEIVDKCLEGVSGPYAIIPKFQTMKQSVLGITGTKTLEQSLQQDGEKYTSGIEIMDDKGDSVYDEEDDILGILEETSSSDEEEEEDEDEEEEELERTQKSKTKTKSKSITPSKEVIFQYHEKSADTKAGFGNGEKIQLNQISDYTELNSINHWRRLLSNGYSTPFLLDGKMWNSIDHYYYASMFVNTNRALYDYLAMDSNSDVSTDYLKAKKFLEKNRKYIEENFLQTKAKDVMYRAMKAKYEQNREARRALLATKNATLYRYIHKREPVKAEILMKVRNEFGL